jgi:ATP-binding cassette subfamily B protein
MTNDLVERMVGHRTRLAQESRTHWHDEEDQALQRHLRLASEVDRAGVQLNALIPRGWVVIGLAALAYRFVTATATPAQIAISLGGILLAFQAFSRLVVGMQSLVQAYLAWQQVEPLFAAAERPQENPAQDLLLMADSPQATKPDRSVEVANHLAPPSSQTLLRAHGLDFRYRDQGRLVLQACSVQIHQGDRLLLEGPSGGGKSTLAALLAGLRSPSAGLLLLWGFDRQTTGQAEWRRRVVAVPQFHENHVLTGTLAFNLLMGRRWPPQPQDLAEAETLCAELGLGDLLARMPAGMQQMVGESGWRLSHGERSRLFMARALLQAPELILFDESFAALDPENLRIALECVLRRAPTVCVIAHP